YAFGNQPRIAQWNLLRFAETLLPLLADDEEGAARLATESVERFSSAFESAYGRVFRRKLGFTGEDEADLPIAASLLERLASNEVDFTAFFRKLSRCAVDP